MQLLQEDKEIILKRKKYLRKILIGLKMKEKLMIVKMPII